MGIRKSITRRSSRSRASGALRLSLGVLPLRYGLYRQDKNVIIKSVHERRKDMRITDIPQLEKLTTPEKILLVEDIWDNISSEESAIPVPQSHIKELERRLSRHKSGPGTLLSLDELRTKIESRK